MSESHKKKEITVNADNCTGCLTCQIRCSFQWQNSFNPAEAFIQIIPGENCYNYDISYKEGCQSCLICARHCPYGALEIEAEGGSDDGN